MTSLAQLQQGQCRQQLAPLAEGAIKAMLALLPGWQREGERIVRTYSFGNYYETMAFVNALAYIAHQQDHHPELTVTYNRCTVKFDTHSAHGLSENDFICAARADMLLAQRAA
jgi:4a-hydroxytetrahydrobiopterin dehydratase